MVTNAFVWSVAQARCGQQKANALNAIVLPWIPEAATSALSGVNQPGGIAFLSLYRLYLICPSQGTMLRFGDLPVHTQTSKIAG